MLQKKEHPTNSNKRRQDWRKLDPEYERERQRYENPTPSRRYILEVLESQDGPLKADELASCIGLGSRDDFEAFRHRLGAMVRDGSLAQNRRGAFGVVSHMSLVPGRVIAHRDGYGFLTPDEGGDDVFMSPREMRSLMSGDRVLVRVNGEDARGRREGVLVDVLERANQTVVGRYIVEHGVAHVSPDNPRIHHDILIPEEGRNGAREGQMVVAAIEVHPGARSLPVGRVVEVLGDHLAPGMEIEAAIRAHGLPHVWPEAVEREAAKVPQKVSSQQAQGRVDLRDLPLVTIDGADARDFDDAVYCKPMRGPLRNGWTLWVAIADVDAYVPMGSALDTEARERGNSVYFPERVIPMLPEALSNGVCSLNPDVERLCMVCEMRINKAGEVTRARFYEGVMRSHARLTYDEVYSILENPDGPEAQARKAVVPQLQDLDALFGAFFSARERRGAMDFETTETKIRFGENRKIEKIVPVQRNRAHRIIEECMIAANVQAARYVVKHKRPSLFRVHATPDVEKVKVLREFLAARGLKLGGGETPTPKDYAAVAAQLPGRDDQSMAQSMLLRSMMQARYSPSNDGHFGLALEEYAHFTSPIRRYPDLVLHRALKHAIRREAKKTFAYDQEQLEALGAHCAMTERRADEATRDVTLWLKCEYMRDRVGEVFDGVIVGVTSFGAFVELKDLYVEGLVHVSTLYNDYYQFDPKRMRMVGERNGRVYALGDAIRVKVVRVSLDERKIDLEPEHSQPRSVQKPFTKAPNNSREHAGKKRRRSSTRSGK
ncbi:MAG: ribonuclease R [Pseudomonadota bacterium]|nr:ribonuclease R [Pseudomonadota bacterium]